MQRVGKGFLDEEAWNIFFCLRNDLLDDLLKLGNVVNSRQS